jgi:hypothetical protein
MHPRLAWLCLLAACAGSPEPMSETPPPPEEPKPAGQALQPVSHEQPVPVAATAEPSSAPPAEPAGPPPPLPRGTVVLQVGDSMAQALGPSLKMELEKRGIRAPFKWKEATYIPQWAGFTMGLAEALAQNDPDLVIVSLGGNEVGMPDPSVRAEGVRTIVKKIGDRPCLWIAAPLWPGAPHTGILDVIRKNCEPCRYVDTNVLIPDLERLGDHVHPTIPERKRWASFMIRWMQHNRDPQGRRPWDFKESLSPPPPGSESWQ